MLFVCMRSCVAVSLLVTIYFGSLSQVWAQENMRHEPVSNIVSPEKTNDLLPNLTSGGNQLVPPPPINGAPGFSTGTFYPVTPEEAERAIHSRPLKPEIILAEKNKIISDNTAPVANTMGVAVSMESSPNGPTSIAELARALKYDVDLIYQFVHDNIEYYPVWGIQKGALGSLLDKQGTDFDQAALMVALLRESNYTANFVKGQISTTGYDLEKWLGIDYFDGCATLSALASGSIPVASFSTLDNFGASNICPDDHSMTLTAQFEHVWVKVKIDGKDYVFDPSYKTHTFKWRYYNLPSVIGYNSSTYLTDAKVGMSTTNNSVQTVNGTKVRSNLTSYANNLSNYLRSNFPSGVLSDVIGGMTINPLPEGKIRQTKLPNLASSVTTEWTEIPTAYKPSLRIQYQGIDTTYYSDAIYGKRLTITFNTSNLPVLMLDGVIQKTGTTPITLGTSSPLTLTVTHGAYALTVANKTRTLNIKAGGTYLIADGWGPAGRGIIDKYRTQLDEAKAASSPDNSETVMGLTLAILSSTWLSQLSQVAYINDRLTDTTTYFHHMLGIAGYYNSSYVDFPEMFVNQISKYSDIEDERANFYSTFMHSSILESTTVQQITGTSAVSTTKLIDIANQNNITLYNADKNNYTSSVKPNLKNCESKYTTFQTLVDNGYRLVIPSDCKITENDWTGAGYFVTPSNASSQIVLGSIIEENKAGGYATTSQSALQLATDSFSNSVSSDTLNQSTGNAFGEPIDMVNGHYLYDHNDITTGIGAFPMSLNFQRLYSSGRRTQDGPLGKGWTHNLAASANVGSDGFQGLGEDSALDAASTIVEMMVSLDLLRDPNIPLDKMAIATLGHRWFGDQLINNTVIVRQGLNGEVFVKLPDGTYNAPPGNSAMLSKNADSTYTYETLNRTKLNFDSTGKISTYVQPNGVQVNYTYSGNDLSKVTNSLGRSLTFTNTNGRISKVADGTRSVQYSYDTTSGNLTKFTDAVAKDTTFEYDPSGRLTKFFYPSNPTVAFITNIYDTLGRVQTQTNANGKDYSYYFAGSRSEEVAPGNISRISYLNALGKVVKSIDPLGHTTTQTYDGQSRLVSTVLPEGNSVTYTYDDAPCSAQKRCTHNIKTMSRVPKPGTYTYNETTSYTYENSFNQVASVTKNPGGKVTTYTYTNQGAPLTVTYMSGPTTSYAYISYTPSDYPTFYLQSSETRKISSSKSVVTATSYDTTNKYVPATTVVDSGTGTLNLTTSYTFDAFGNLTKIDGPRTDVTDTVTNGYDAERRVIQITDALGKFTRQAYDNDGRLVRSAAQIGTQWLVSCRRYTSSGKLLKAWGPRKTALDTTCPSSASPAAVTDYAYDDLDRLWKVTENLTTADGGNRVSVTAYNADDSVQSVSRAVGSNQAQTYAAYTYTPNGLLATVKDAKNNLTTYQYNGFDRKSKTLFPDKVTPNTSSTTDYERYLYYSDGNLGQISTLDGKTVTLVYDNFDRLISRSYEPTRDSSGYPKWPYDVNFSYDLLGRRLTANNYDGSYAISYAWDNAGRLTSTSAGGKTMSFEYDAAGNRTKTTWPETSPFYVTTTYDKLNRPTDIKELGTTTLATYSYNDLSQRAGITSGSNTATSYHYNDQSALDGMILNLFGTAQDNTIYSSRNQVGEIVHQIWNNEIYQWNGAVNATTNYTTNGLNQYTLAGGANLKYDIKGNLTSDGVWAYGYDKAHRLSSATRTGLAMTLNYDAEGRLRKTSTGPLSANVTNLLYDGTNLVAEYNGAGNLLRRYVHGPGIDEPLVWYEGSGTANKSWLYSDNQGSIIATANSAGTSTGTYTYGPYGEPSSTTGPRFRYTGQQFIGDLGLYYYKARFYSPSLGRFLQPDPIGFQDDMNLYAYVQNNPVNFVDPTGLISWSRVGLGALEAGAGGAGIAAAAYTEVGSVGTATGVAVGIAAFSAPALAHGVTEMAAGFMENGNNAIPPIPPVSGPAIATLAATGNVGRAQEVDLITGAMMLGKGIGSWAAKTPSNFEAISAGADFFNLAGQSTTMSPK